MDNIGETIKCVICGERFVTNTIFKTCSDECLKYYKSFKTKKSTKIYIKNCDTCGKLFTGHSPQSRFCRNNICSHVGKVSKIHIKNCEVCGELFISRQSNGKYCKKNGCAKIALYNSRSSKIYIKNCEICGELFTSRQSHGKSCKKNGCIKKAPYIGKSSKIYIKDCEICGELFVTAKPNILSCSDDCEISRIKIRYQQYRQKYKNNKNEKNKNTISECERRVINKVEELIEKATDTRNWSEIDYFNIGGFNDKLKDMVKDRDDYRCQICGFESFLEVHHIVPRKFGGSHSLENLITLCTSCHRAVETKDVKHATSKCLKNIKRNSNSLIKPNYQEKYLKLQSNMSNLFNEINRLLDDGDSKSEILVMLNMLIE